MHMRLNNVSNIAFVIFAKYISVLHILAGLYVSPGVIDPCCV